MEDQTSWRGHTFTLLVFTGIVVLCSIFFILGMLVGRAQAQKLATSGPTAVARTESKAAAKDEKPDLTFYDSVKKEESPVVQLEPQKTDPSAAAAEPSKRTETEAAPAPADASAAVVNFQIAALRKGAEAEKLLDDLKKKGFRAFI